MQLHLILRSLRVDFPDSHYATVMCSDPANVRNLIQNSYANDWINNNMEKEAAMRGSPTKKGGIGLTRAAEGHAFGAHTKYIVPADADEPFKMSKFKGVPSKVSTRR